MQKKDKIKVLVADDSAFMRRIISDIINSDKELEVVATARNGEEALQKIKTHQPDVVTLDMEMPVMNGLVTLEKIMAENPLPVVMLSAFTKEGAAATIGALEKGAVDFITKPGAPVSLDTAKIDQEIINKIKTAAAVPIRMMVKKTGNTALPVDRGRPNTRPQISGCPEGSVFTLVAIGTSTGGPKALQEVMSRLSPGMNMALLIVQHMPPGFTKSLAQRLDSLSPFSVKEAEEGDTVTRGRAYVAPGDYHMEVYRHNELLKIRLSKSPSVNGHRPSVDVLMNSVAQCSSIPKVGVIMTGMGSDGAYGMKMLKEAGAFNIGESAETCVVYGMPRSAYKLGVIDLEVPVYKIADYIEQAAKKN